MREGWQSFLSNLKHEKRFHFKLKIGKLKIQTQSNLIIGFEEINYGKYSNNSYFK